MARNIVFALPLLTTAVGLTQVLAAAWWVGVTERFAGPALLRVSGLVGTLIGAILIYAAIRRLVGLRQFVLVLGAFTTGISLVAVANPSFYQDLLFALVLNRARFYQLTVTRLAGLVRIGIGLALLYAVKYAPLEESSSACTGS